MYQHGRRVQRPHNYKIFLATVAVIGVVVLVVWFMIHKDIANTTAPKSNVPIVSTIADGSGDTITIQEPYFSFELPSDWKFQTEVHQTYANSYTWASTKKGGDDRTLTIHVDIMPQDYKIVKMLPLTSNGASFLLGNVSDDCVKFSGTEVQRKSNASFQAKWQDVLFMCDPMSANQTAGTGSKKDGIGAPLSGSKGTHKYFFYYEDHNIRPDSSILRDAVSSFKAK
jgi:hypothetical protein